MRLQYLNEVSVRNGAVVCRPSRAWAAAFGLATLVAFVGGLSWLWSAQPAAGWLLAVISLIGVAIAFVFTRASIAAFRGDAWVLAIEPARLLLNFRSHHNHRFERSPVVLELGRHEVRAVRRAWESWSRPSGDDDSHSTVHAIDLLLKNALPDEVLEEIRRERTRRTFRSFLGVTSQGRNNHNPIRVLAPDALRIAWRGPQDFLTPSITAAIDLLGQDLPVLGDASGGNSGWRKASDEEVDELVMAALESGDEMTAILMLRERRGYSLTDAKGFVGELTAV